jgi:hypothetical protein
VAQLVGIADDIDRGDFRAVDGHAQGEIEFAVQKEQGADGAVDDRRFDPYILTGALSGPWVSRELPPIDAAWEPPAAKTSQAAPV